MEDFVKFSYCSPPTQRAPIRLDPRFADILLYSALRDGLITSRHRQAILGRLSSIKRGAVTLDLLEGIAPSDSYRVFRYLRRFFSTSVDPAPAVYPLQPTMPYTSLLPPLYTLATSPWKPARIVVELSKGVEMDSRLLRDAEVAASLMGAELTVVKEKRSLGASSPIYEEVEPVDLLAVALGDLRQVGADILSEVVGGGGVITGKALLELLDERGVRALRLLLYFDFLRMYPSQGGLLIYISEKGLECVE